MPSNTQEIWDEVDAANLTMVNPAGSGAMRRHEFVAGSYAAALRGSSGAGRPFPHGRAVPYGWKGQITWVDADFEAPPKTSTSLPVQTLMALRRGSIGALGIPTHLPGTPTAGPDPLPTRTSDVCWRVDRPATTATTRTIAPASAPRLGGLADADGAHRDAHGPGEGHDPRRWVRGVGVDPR